MVLSFLLKNRRTYLQKLSGSRVSEFFYVNVKTLCPL
uniref:Uncharacterized protein n=1 Tax=Rhizophora mucronata TaxID=61149 RepID=A0A2P2NQ33_RHIMU